MRQTLQIIDDLLPPGVAKALREDAIKLPFEEREYKGGKYPNIAFLPREWTIIIASQLNLALGCRTNIHMSFLRCSMENEETPQWIHADNGESQYAAVFYLSEPETEEDGTSFWRNRNHDADQTWEGITEKEATALNEEGQKVDFWEKVGHASQRFNRLIVYPTRLFHSRFPRYSQGVDVETGRLIWVAFFDKE